MSAQKALTANDLVTGRVIFLARGDADGWTLRFSEAQVFGDEAEAETALARAKAQTVRIADPYLIDLAEQGGFVAPLSLRERIRALGPTTEPDLGVQSEGGPVTEALQKAVGAARSTGRLGLILRH